MQQESYAPILKNRSLIRIEVLKVPAQKIGTIYIVLADDDLDEQFLFEKAIKGLPVATNVKIVSDGKELMEYLLQTRVNPPDVIFLDIMMPCKNGIECLQEIKSHIRLKEIPVIMYSNSVSEDYITKAYEYGASWFLPKGEYFELAESISRLLAIIKKTPQQAPKEKFKFCL